MGSTCSGPQHAGSACLDGGGEMGARMRAFDWSASLLGPVSGWPLSLQTAVSLLLSSRFPMFLFCGSEAICLYNDAYRPSLGRDKHPKALGQRGSECWAEIWHIIGPQIARVMSIGEPSWHEDQLVPFDRNGYLEEIYFTYSYSPVRELSGEITAALVVCQETTTKVLAARRMLTLRDLAAAGAKVRDAGSAARELVDILAQNHADLPFVLLYTVEDRKTAHLTANVGVAPGSPVAAEHIALTGPGRSTGWPLAAVHAQRKPLVIPDLRVRFPDLPVGDWIAWSNAAIILPIALPGENLVRALLVAGISENRTLDGDYRDFFGLVAQQFSAGLAAATAHERERAAREQAEESNHMKDEFLAVVSHELRTPLSAMLGYLHMLRRGQLADADRDRALEKIQSNATAQAQLIDDLLDVSRIITGKMHLDRRPVDPSVVVQAAADTVRPQAEAAAIELVVSAEPGLGLIYIHPERFQQVLWNLLVNAVKFTPAGGVIEMTLSRSGASVDISVTDTGCGISEEFLPHVFDRFRQADSSIGRSHGGLGLGLAIVRHLVELHQGTVSASSPGKGLGSTFIVSMPVFSGATWAPARPTHAVTLPDYDSDTLAGVRILLAEDESELREVTAGILAGAGAEVIEAEDGAAALAIFERWIPDVLVSDIGMPVMDGLALLRRVRDRAAAQGGCVPAVALTAYARIEDRADAIVAGFQVHLAKPVKESELVHAVARLVREDVKSPVGSARTD